MRLNKAQYAALLKPKSKYSNVKTVVDGITFDSAAEAAYYENLKDSIRIGVVKYFLRQVPFHLPGGVVYRCDFMVVGFDDSIQYPDVKGCVTAMFRLKRKQVEALYPVKITCVKRVGSHGRVFREID